MRYQTALLSGVVASIAYFEITRPSAYTNSANRFVLDGEVEYKGTEFTAFGKLTPDLTLTASALMMDAKQTRAANAAVLGKQPENTARWTTSLFAEYSLPMLQGVSVNAGVFSIGRRAINAANQAFVPGYTTADLGVRYKWETGGHDYTAQVNVENIFDKGFWSTAGNGLIGQGSPRLVKFAVSAAY